MPKYCCNHGLLFSLNSATAVVVVLTEEKILLRLGANILEAMVVLDKIQKSFF